MTARPPSHDRPAAAAVLAVAVLVLLLVGCASGPTADVADEGPGGGVSAPAPVSPSPSPTETAASSSPAGVTFGTLLAPEDEVAGRTDYFVANTDGAGRVTWLGRFLDDTLGEEAAFASAERADLPSDAELVAEYGGECPRRVYRSVAAGGIVVVTYFPPLPDDSAGLDVILVDEDLGPVENC